MKRRLEKWRGITLFELAVGGITAAFLLIYLGYSLLKAEDL
ncbi:MAG: potassium-transporting ATPase subunit F [Peptococcaceae bacterium]|nr:potassium-transporting ATPase subunit F [Peptococcaceae bacterium]